LFNFSFQQIKSFYSFNISKIIDTKVIVFGPNGPSKIIFAVIRSTQKIFDTFFIFKNKLQ